MQVKVPRVRVPNPLTLIGLRQGGGLIPGLRRDGAFREPGRGRHCVRTDMGTHGKTGCAAVRARHSPVAAVSGVAAT